MSDAFETPSPSSPYWRSLGELGSSEEFLRHLEAEFPDQASVPVDGMSRRRFLSLMAASAALVGMSGCRWPREEIVPFGKRPESYQPGKVKRFATTFAVGEAIKPVLVTSYDGRPIKVEGANGGTDAHSQAEILSLYDPDRSKTPRRKVGGYWRGATWSEFETEIKAELARTNGEGLAVLLPESASVVQAQALERLAARYPEARIFRHEPLSSRNEREALERITSRADMVSHRNPLGDQPTIVLDLQSNFLQEHPNACGLAAAFARLLHPDRTDPVRLYSFESGFSITGAMADHRIPLATQDMVGVLVLLAEALLRDEVSGADSLRSREALQAILGRLPMPRIHERLSGHRSSIEALGEDLLEHRKSCALSVGSHLPPSVQILARLIECFLTGAIDYDSAPYFSRGSYDAARVGSLADLVRDADSGKVRSLLILGVNPVYDAPVDLVLAQVLARIPMTVHLGMHENETAASCDWHLPQTHPLESWDLLSSDRMAFSTQPLIQPLYEGRSIPEVLSLVADPEPTAGYALTREAFRSFPERTVFWREGTPFEFQWRTLLSEGSLLQEINEGESPGACTSFAVNSILIETLQDAIRGSESPLGPDDLELNFAACPKIHDGRFANNGWLQELPDPVTKLTWDNALLISPALADEKGLKQGDMVELKYRERSLEVPVYVLPGQAPYSMTLNLGYGRSAAGNVGNGVGFNAYQLRTSDAPWGGAGATITPTGRRYPLACTQDHHAIDTRGYEERERRAHALIREGTYAEHREHPNFAEHMGVHHPPLLSLWEERGYDGLKWGMSIDLNACTGCNACVVACQAENNVSVVGKDEILRGREMHWLRIDRYFSGDPASPTMANQPMACVHCEMAPCEQVCPVAATMHNEEGLNVMVYNRCVGTRYCANNCPYKVRRFNYFNNQEDLSEVEALAHNPEVTVRSRGVMEKCTYCVQRIEHARISAKNERREIRDGEIVTACQQTCPTQAIVFGDLNDENSAVRKRAEDPRSYAVLAELNVKPRTTYMARLRNPNPRLVPESEHGGGHSAGHGDAHTTGPSDDATTSHAGDTHDTAH